VPKEGQEAAGLIRDLPRPDRPHNQMRRGTMITFLISAARRRKILLAALAAVLAGLLALPPAASANTSASPTILVFGNQAVGTTSAPQTVTVDATCTVFMGSTCIAPPAFLTTGIIYVPPPGFFVGDFAQTNDCGAGILNSPGSCEFNVTFSPKATGTRTATLEVGVDFSSGSTQPDPITLAGTGVAPPPPPGPTPTAPTATTATSTAPTGLRAAALKKCRKRFPKGPRRAKCLRKAKGLPV
jgi:hypothetical protein